MRRFIAAAALLIAPAVFAHDHEHHRNMNVTTDDDEINSCDQIRVSFDHEAALRAEEELPVGSLRSLKVTTDTNSGVRVAGWDQARYAVTVCKFAADGATLADVHPRLGGNEITLAGPDSDKQWYTFLIVHTPSNAQLDVSTHNGPVSLQHVNGTLNLRAQNGPLSLRDSSGTIDAVTVNGPISLSGGSGNVKISATNGPVSVKLSGARWDGTLDARTQNGPLSLRLPRTFGSGVDLTVDRGPISCKADACRDLKRSWHDDDNDRPRKLSFGSGARNVTLSTVNGPVVVKESD